MEHLTEQVDKLFAENKGAEAQKLLEEALQEAYDSNHLVEAVPILNELIGYCRETSLVEQSYAYAEKVQEILQKLGLEGTLPHATTLLNIANAYRAGGRLEDSLQKYEEVARIYTILLEMDDMLWASFYNNLSLLYQEMGRFDLAKESLLKALSIVVQKKDTIFEQAVTYTNLANTCLQLGQGDEAEKYFTGAILLFERHNMSGAHYCAALSALGTYHYQKKEYFKAEEYFTKAMLGIEESLGRNEFYERMKDNVQICKEAMQALQEPVLCEENRAEAENAMLAKREAMSPADLLTKVEKTLQARWQGEKADNKDAVSGLTLCKEYYVECFKPMLEAKFPQYTDKIAVGLVGEGSDCFGYDDELSRDHDWGPSLLLWVTDEVYEEIGEALEEAYDKLPKEYQGYVYKESWQGKNRRGVHRIGGFYRNLLGAENCPKDDEEWTTENIKWEAIEDSRLAAAVNGEVFTDAEGVFSTIRQVLKNGYPESIQYLKIAESAARFSQAAQYNYARVLKRGDIVTAQMMLADGMREAMKLLYYAAGEYPPHDKWLFRGLQEKQEYAQILGFIEKALVTSGDKELLLEKLGEALAQLLYRKGYISDVDGFLQEHVNELLFKASVAEERVEDLAERIARTEFEAFDKVKNQGGRAGCQDDWFTFSIMRKSQYLTWNRSMLLQYLYDFTREYTKGHNLIEEKYGRMMESTAPAEYEKMKAHFPVLSEEKKQIIERIVGIQVKWMEEFAAEYPKLAGNARSIHTYEDHAFNTSYETYLRGELGTYSDKMLELYGRYIVEYAQKEKNLAKDIMEHSVLMYGYEGLDDAEAGL